MLLQNVMIGFEYVPDANPKQKLPPFALVNNMCVRAITPELSCLNNMEKRLISEVQPFMKLVVLSYGQQALKG